MVQYPLSREVRSPLEGILHSILFGMQESLEAFIYPPQADLVQLLILRTALRFDNDTRN
jgi:hypothetical protein